mmetsp:Transcript_39233/g.100540  ORF Transcript_39233/g.100540 Transcript_39233/m.100540 type:complete len:242 (+) Transcript_39233:177-902(+)
MKERRSLIQHSFSRFELVTITRDHDDPVTVMRKACRPSIMASATSSTSKSFSSSMPFIASLPPPLPLSLTDCAYMSTSLKRKKRRSCAAPDFFVDIFSISDSRTKRLPGMSRLYAMSLKLLLITSIFSSWSASARLSVTLSAISRVRVRSSLALALISLSMPSPASSSLSSAHHSPSTTLLCISSMMPTSLVMCWKGRMKREGRLLPITSFFLSTSAITARKVGSFMPSDSVHSLRSKLSR